MGMWFNELLYKAVRCKTFPGNTYSTYIQQNYVWNRRRGNIRVGTYCYSAHVYLNWLLSRIYYMEAQVCSETQSWESLVGRGPGKVGASGKHGINNVNEMICLTYLLIHYNDVIMSAMALQITGLNCLRNRFLRRHWPSWGESTGDRRIPLKKLSVTRKIFPFDDVIMIEAEEGMCAN